MGVILRSYVHMWYGRCTLYIYNDYDKSWIQDLCKPIGMMESHKEQINTDQIGCVVGRFDLIYSRTKACN